MRFSLLSITLFIFSVAIVHTESTQLLLAQENAVVKTNPDHQTRAMTIQIRDENGKPLANAELQVGLWYREGYQGPKLPKRNFVTDATGTVVLNIPRRLDILRLWARKPGYVPEFVNFGRGTHEEGRKIPDAFEFQLARGTTLSGVVVDEQGTPIPNVTALVEVNVNEPVWTVNPKPMISLHTEAVTDDTGKWSIKNAPAQSGEEDFQFLLKLNHPEYLSDSKPGELQKQQNVTTAMLRAGSARIVMRRGITVKGTVVNTAGDPVTEGLVIWKDDPYSVSGVHETQVKQDGKFETLPLKAGEYPITVVIPGYKPILQTITVTKSMDDLAFVMKPGKTLTLKVIDPSGEPVPKAYVGLRKWRGIESLYNWQHPNVVPDSQIPRRTDKNGVYVWDWAPDEPVKFAIFAKPFASKEVTLVATEKEHVIQLDRPLIAKGKVTDAQTGKPIKEFRVIPVIEFRPQFWSTSFQASGAGQEGQYEITLNEGRYDRRHRIRVEADGYRSAISETSYGLGEKPVTKNFALEPAEPLTGTVVNEAGNPVSGATVVVGTPSIVPYIRNGELEWGGTPLKTSSDGQFQLAASFEPTRIRAFTDSHFAEVVRRPGEAIGTIRVKPWAQISGRLFQAGKPVADQLVLFKTVQRLPLGEPRFQDSFSTQTDADGFFEFKRLPPVAGTVQAHLGPWQESPLTSSQSVALELQPGDQKTIELGNQGTTLKGTVIATGRGEVGLNKNWSLNYLIRRDQGLPLPDDFPELSFDPEEPVQPAWALDPNFYSWLGTRQQYFVKLAPDGQLQIGGVPPGEYDLLLRLYEQPAGCLVETVGSKVIPVTVTRADSETPVQDLGSIEVPCRVGPQAGESMYAYKFTDVSGQQRTIHDMKGRYVLMHVWASWCVPCLKSLPDIKAARDQLTDKPITFVGLNLDKQTEEGRALVEKHQWNWSQNYLGDNSDMARQLAISSVPIYYLIGPDGRLIVSTSEWSEMKQKLDTALNQNP